MRKIIGICGKSGSSKTTLINNLIKVFPDMFHNVTSYTTRAERTEDPNDKLSHIFVDDKFWEDNKHKAIAVYYSPKGYISWTDENSFSNDKINLYAIDTKALNNELYPTLKEKGWGVGALYIHVKEEERKKRYLAREGTLDGFDIEDHIDYSHLEDMYIASVVNANGNKLESFTDFLSKVEYMVKILK